MIKVLLFFFLDLEHKEELAQEEVKQVHRNWQFTYDTAREGNFFGMTSWHDKFYALLVFCERSPFNSDCNVEH